MGAPHPILVAEDSPADFFLINRQFSRGDFKASLFHVEDGESAIAYLEGRAPYDDRNKYPLPEVVVTDLKMPRVTGFELLAWMRQQEKFKNTPVIVVSSSDEPEDIKRAKEFGIIEYVQKMLAFDEPSRLVAAVARCCDGNGQS